LGGSEQGVLVMAFFSRELTDATKHVFAE